MSANEKIMSDNATLSSSIGTENLDEDEIKAEIAGLKAENQGYVTSRSHCVTQLSSQSITEDVADMTSYYTGQISLMTSYINGNTAAIAKLQEKLDKIAQIVAATADLFVHSEAMYSFVSQGIAELSRSWNSSSGMFMGVSSGWQEALNNPEQLEKEIAAVEQLKKEGFTQEEIDKMREINYTATELLGEWNSLKTKEDKEFYKLMTKGSEEAFLDAFSINPDDLSDSLFEAILNYTQKQITLDGSEAPENVTNLMNGLFGQRADLITGAYPNHGQTTDVANQRVKTYISRISQQTGLQMNQTGMVLVYDEDSLALRNYYDKMRSLDNFWETMYVINPVKTTNGGYPIVDQYKFGKISNLTFHSPGEKYTGEVSFNMQHFVSYSLDGKGIPGTTDEFNSSRIATWSGFKSAEGDKLLAELRQEKADYWKKVVTTVGIFAVGIWQPWIGATMGLAASMGDMSDVVDYTGASAKELDDILTKKRLAVLKANGDNRYDERKKYYEANKKLRQNTISALTTAADLYSGWNKLTKKEQEAKQDKLNDILNIGGLQIKKNGDVHHLAFTPLEKMDYKQQQRTTDFTTNGYRSYFNTLDNREDIVNMLELMAKNQVDDEEEDYTEKHATIVFMLSGGDPYDSKIHLDTITEIMEDVGKNLKMNKDQTDVLKYDIKDFFHEENYVYMEKNMVIGL